ncbi:8-amino-7-oxononanoate synthase [Enterovibrio sp. ZSDZ42]|uniref:8-amino-7-ketopelargonate synthase n=1 Tax=Enterovibrio gelatinilyticus TaxID=2899819 RepID=A0ABT5R470_9GAMM|nr:8-amino-7-oxononanoate synthase [Enterovibrio sp. ZSDZ42]MDD1794576.1 8-amino-7-oxononanoate synthase [Enterovibrio sp. ZSDZ42]
MRQDSHLQRRIEQKLDTRRQQKLLRNVSAFHHQDGKLFDTDNQPYVNFSGNDYLGLAHDPSVIKAWQDGLEQFGAGSTASPLVTGFTRAHQHLEHTLCDWLGFERALLFNSGFSANQAVIFSLLEKQDVLLQDKLNHASLMEAGMLCDAKMQRFPHNNINKLKSLLQANEQTPARFVVTEGVFSMDGDLSPLAEIRAACDEHDAWLMVDDAHGVGVLGDEGQGSAHLANVKPDILVVTFGKAFGMMGAAVLCSEQVHDYFTQFARHYVYSTAMPPAQAHALSHTLSMIRTQSWRREKLSALSDCFHNELKNCTEVVDTITPIKPVVLGDVEKMQLVASNLKKDGFLTGAIRPPTVPVNTARLRITLSVNQSETQVKDLAVLLRRCIEEGE